MTRITDVARAAGVSPATVSRVLNQPDLVVPEKRERVLAAVRELNYTPNPLAHGLRAGSVNTVALLVGDISQPFHGAFAKSIDRCGEAHGYRVLLRDLDHNEGRLLKALGELKTSDTYGVVLATADNLSTPPVLEAIAEAQQRGLVVVSSSQVVNGSIPAIVPRYQAISHLATLHLATLGMSPIVFVGGGDQSPLSRERKQGFERACAELGFSDTALWELDGRFAVDATREAMERLFTTPHGAALLAGGSRFGVVAVNMRMAIGVMQAAQDFGLDIPGRLGLVCCEELPLAAEWRPAVTTVGIDFDALAEATFAALIAGKEAEPVSYLPHRLIVRSTSAPPQPAEPAAPRERKSRSASMKQKIVVSES
jgi:DNA-binding LacI/PurR family transcriptional regulator